MKVKYDEYIIKCTYKELSLIRSSLRTLEYDFKTHRFNDYQDPPHVRNQQMLEMKSESHGRRFV